MAVQKKINYNYCLDMLKGIACFCVVCMHCEFPGKLGIMVQALSRFCVPFFFMVSGYFSFYPMHMNASNIYNKVKHILKLTAEACICNVIYFLIQYFIGINSTFEISMEGILIFLLFNQPSILMGSYWFLFALIYVYIIYIFIIKYNLTKTAFISIPFLLCCYIVLAQGLHLAGYKIPNYIYRNFLIEGFPYFTLGYYLHSKQDKIQINNKALIIAIIVSTVMCLGERSWLGRDFGVNICTIPQVIAIFLFGIKNPLCGKKLSNIGKKYSMYVYIFHPVIWRLLNCY